MDGTLEARSPAAQTVSFVVPCYNLAEYLPECVGSILAQTYPHIEILIVDDCSPDDTPAVSAALIAAHPDRDIRYVRNARNLRNIRTYNAGIRQARGAYVWILSPDDRLRSPQIVQTYVAAMQSDPELGFAFCPGHTIEDGRDTGLRRSSQYRAQDGVVPSRRLIRDIVWNSFELLAPSVLIRKRLYEEATFFPEDLPHRGDSFLWAVIAMHAKAIYFATPMVDYRIHAKSMMSTAAREEIGRLLADDIRAPWRIRQAARLRRRPDVARECLRAVVHVYARLQAGVTCRGHAYRMTAAEFEASLLEFEADPRARARLRARVRRAMLWRRARRHGQHALNAAIALVPRPVRRHVRDAPGWQGLYRRVEAMIRP